MSTKPAAGRHRGQWPALGLAECRGSPSPSYPVGRDRIRHRVRRNDTPEALAAVPSFRAGHSATVSTRAPACAPVRYGPHGSEVIPKSADAARFGVLAREISTRPGAPARGESTAQFTRPVASTGRPSAFRGPSWTKDTPTSDLQERKSRSAETDRLEIEQAAREERIREHEQVLRPPSGSQRDDEGDDYAVPLPTLARCRAGGRSRAAVSRRAGHAGGNPRPDPLSGCPVRVVADPRIPAGRPDRTARARSANGFR